MLFSPQPNMSMLDPEDRQQAGYAGLLALAQGLIAGGAPSTQPGGMGRGLAEGLGGFGKAYRDTGNMQLQQKMFGMQLSEAQRKQDAQRRLSTAMGGVNAPVQLADASQPGAASMQQRMNGGQQGAQNYQQALASPEAQSALMELYGPAGIAAIRQMNAPIAVAADQGLFVPGQGWVQKPGAKPPTVQEFFDDQGKPYKAEFDTTSGTWRRVGGSKSDILTPDAVKQKMDIARAGGSQVTVDNRAENEEQKGFGGDLVKEYSTIRERAAAAEDARNQIRMARAFADTDATGKALPSVMQQKAGNAAVALGFNVDTPAMKAMLGRISDGQSFTGTMQNLVLTKMQAQKGPQTENDAKRIEQTVASLGNTPEARDFLLRAADALSFEDTYKRQHWDKHMTDKKTFMGAAKSWSDLRKSVPFMGVSPNTNKPVFFSEFYDANSHMPVSEVLNAWRQQYGR